eukprot:COSAG06_NODE_101_length_24097_cov_15.305150_10_plen_108_part_00
MQWINRMKRRRVGTYSKFKSSHHNQSDIDMAAARLWAGPPTPRCCCYLTLSINVDYGGGCLSGFPRRLLSAPRSAARTSNALAPRAALRVVFVVCRRDASDCSSLPL